MKLSEKLTHRHFTIAALVVGISLPLYAMADTPPAADTTTKVVTQTTTTTVKHKSHKSHHAGHKASAAANKADAVNNAKALDAEAANGASTDKSDANKGTEKRVVWKNGVVFHDVEPSGQAASPFGAPTSTSDTLKGDVTTSPASSSTPPTPQQ